MVKNETPTDHFPHSISVRLSSVDLQLFLSDSQSFSARGPRVWSARAGVGRTSTDRSGCGASEAGQRSAEPAERGLFYRKRQTTLRNSCGSPPNGTNVPQAQRARRRSSQGRAGGQQPGRPGGHTQTPPDDPLTTPAQCVNAHVAQTQPQHKRTSHNPSQ